MSEVLHLKTQRNQPYGSTRRCCERCGVMIWIPPVPQWTDDPDVYENPPDGYVRCDRAKDEPQRSASTAGKLWRRILAR